MAFTKILCPVDFSPGSQQALRTAVRIAGEHDAELVVMHSWYIPPAAFAGDYVYGADIVQSLTDDAQHALDAAVAEARRLGTRRVSSRMRSGLPWQQICEAAQREPGLGLIVIGTHGRSGLPRVVMGSVAELVVRHAPCPVLAVRFDSEPAPYRRVLCPVDLSRPARDAIPLAATLVRPGGAGITLLHVIERPVAYAAAAPPRDFHREIDARAAALLDAWTADLQARVDVPVTQATRVGRPGAQILALLDDDKSFDLVVMGSHGHTGIARVLLGSVAEQVVRHARCPVLVAHGTLRRRTDMRLVPPARPLRFSAWAPFPIAMLVAIAAGVAIANPAIYARETASWAAQGIGQDWINLLVCAPALLAGGALALVGSRGARVVVAGLLLYTAYSFAIYAFAMHFTPLFLVHCGLLGGSAFALGDLVAGLGADGAGSWYRAQPRIRLAGGTLLAVAVIFGALWLREIIPALLAGSDPPGLAEVGLAANPVHILDLSLVLPAMAATGVAVLRRRPAGLLFAPILLTFGAMMAIAIGGMVAMMRIRGVALDATPTLAMAIVAVWCLGVLIALLRHLRVRHAG